MQAQMQQHGEEAAGPMAEEPLHTTSVTMLQVRSM